MQCKYMIMPFGVLVISANVIHLGCDLAGSEDLEHERQAVRDQLLRVLLLLDAAEVLEQTLDQRPAVLQEAGAQGVEPGVQRPGNAWETQAGGDDGKYTTRLGR